MDVGQISTDEEEDNDDCLDDAHSGSIISVGSICKYPVCVNKTCYKKKLDEKNKCPTCKTRIGRDCAGVGFMLKMGIESKGVSDVYTAFNDTAVKLLKDMSDADIASESEEEIEDFIFERLPIKISFVSKPGNILNLLVVLK